jgi:hypothetical protein
MPKVKNLSGAGLDLLRYRILPDSRVLCPDGTVTSDLPGEVACTTQAKHLVDTGALEIAGYAKTEPPAPPKEPEAEPVGTPLPEVEPEEAEDEKGEESSGDSSSSSSSRRRRRRGK